MAGGGKSARDGRAGDEVMACVESGGTGVRGGEIRAESVVGVVGDGDEIKVVAATAVTAAAAISVAVSVVVVDVVTAAGVVVASAAMAAVAVAVSVVVAAYIAGEVVVTCDGDSTADEEVAETPSSVRSAGSSGGGGWCAGCVAG